MEATGVLFLFFAWLLYEALVRARERFRSTGDQSLSLFCPTAGNDVEVSTGEREVVWEDEGRQEYGFRCDNCGHLHVWHFGPPVPIYMGDKIILKSNGEGNGMDITK